MTSPITLADIRLVEGAALLHEATAAELAFFDDEDGRVEHEAEAKRARYCRTLARLLRKNRRAELANARAGGGAS